MKRKLMKKVQAWTLSIVMVASLLIAGGQPVTVHAANTVKTMNLDTSCLAPSDGTWDQTNDYKVYFGQYNGTPTAFRVLKADDNSLFLDCDTTLVTKEFDADLKANDEQKSGRMDEWAGSDLEKWLNGSDYYGNTAVFTDLEKNAITKTSLSASESDYSSVSDAASSFRDFAASDYVYLLSVREAGDLYKDDSARVKLESGNGVGWWLRSANTASAYGSASVVQQYGFLNGRWVTEDEGVCPAFNLNPASVLLTSAADLSKSSDTLTAVTAGSGVKEWKLTLLDSGKSVEVTSGSSATQYRDTITVPYTYTGSDVNQISVMITSDAYDAAGAEVLYYGKLNTTDSLSGAAGSGTGTFTLPSGLPNGYKIYMMAEKVNGENYTDYASEPVEIVTDQIPLYTVTINSGNADMAEYAEGETVTITADRAPQGKQFKEWTGLDGLTFTDGTSKTSATAKFIMPANAVNVTATYEDIPHSHVWDTNWTSDDNYHWHKCTAAGCDGSVSAKAAHTESAWIVDKEASTTTEGEKHTECTVCHKVMQTEIIPKIKAPAEEDSEQPDDTEKPDSEETPEVSPKTGENTPIVWLFVLCILSGAALISREVVRRKNIMLK